MGDIASEANTTISISHSCSLAAFVTNIVPKIYITTIKAINVSISSLIKSQFNRFGCEFR